MFHKFVVGPVPLSPFSPPEGHAIWALEEMPASGRNKDRFQDLVCHRRRLRLLLPLKMFERFDALPRSGPAIGTELEPDNGRTGLAAENLDVGGLIDQEQELPRLCGIQGVGPIEAFSGSKHNQLKKVYSNGPEKSTEKVS
jgi:hypothetical protein